MTPGLKYALARVGLFVVCALLLFVPRDLNLFLKLLIALVVSAVLSFVLLKGLRDEVARSMSSGARRRIAEKDRLRSALAGEDDDKERGGDHQ